MFQQNLMELFKFYIIKLDFKIETISKPRYCWNDVFATCTDFVNKNSSTGSFVKMKCRPRSA